MAATKVLLVGDGPFMDTDPPQYGINFLKNSGNYVQDRSDNTFTVSELIYLLTTSTPSISVDTAHRRNDPNATFPNFNFATTTELLNYDVLWIIGYEGYNNRPYGSPIADDELQAIAQFMESGGGVFATGDHEGMGSCICGQIPRVRSMRMWYGREGDLPAGAPTTAVNSQGQTVSSVNWPGFSTATIPRADTLQQNPSDSASVFQFDDQSDAFYQTLAFPGGLVHAILEGGHGPISRFPDHMHEGEVVTPSDTSQVLTISGQPFAEYPADRQAQPVPSIIAVGAIVGGHSTMVEGSACEQNNFSNDPMPTVAKPLGVLCAYDGSGVGVGRVVTDSSFHHYLDLNLIGDPCGSSPDRQQGFGPGYTPPAAGSVLADLQAFYVNTALWLARFDAQAPPVISSIDPSTGSTIGGTKVLIQGSNLDGPTAVLFGGTPGTSVNTLAGGTIEATSPRVSAAGPVDIIVHANGQSTSPSPAAVFTYVYAPGVTGITVNPDILWTGQSATGTVTLNEPALPGGTTVKLVVSGIEEASFVTVPATVPVPAPTTSSPGTSATFTITTSTTAWGEATITAGGPDGNALSTAVEISAGQMLLALPLSAGYLLIGQTATGTISVRTPAPAPDGLITLSTSNSAVVSITPAVVDLHAGHSSASFTVTALSAGDFTISANYLGDSATTNLFVVRREPPPWKPPRPPGPTPI
jgi:hypothetical protein